METYENKVKYVKNLFMNLINEPLKVSETEKILSELEKNTDFLQILLDSLQSAENINLAKIIAIYIKKIFTDSIQMNNISILSKYSKEYLQKISQQLTNIIMNLHISSLSEQLILILAKLNTTCDSNKIFMDCEIFRSKFIDNFLLKKYELSLEGISSFYKYYKEFMQIKSSDLSEDYEIPDKIKCEEFCNSSLQNILSILPQNNTERLYYLEIINVLIKFMKMIFDKKSNPALFYNIYSQIYDFIALNTNFNDPNIQILQLKTSKNLGRFTLKFLQTIMSAPPEIIANLLKIFIEFIIDPNKNFQITSLSHADRSIPQIRYTQILFEQALTGMLIIFESPVFWNYSVLFSEGISQPEAEKIKNYIINYVLTNEIIKTLILTFIRKIFILTNEEIELWNSNSEKFYIEQESTSNISILREKAMKISQIICQDLPDKIAEFYLEIDKLLSTKLDINTDFSEFIIRESVYCFIEILDKNSEIFKEKCANDYFNIWINEFLTTDTVFNILKRRILSIFQIIDEKLRKNALNYTKLLEIIGQEFKSNKDLCIKSVCINYFQNVINSENFNPEIIPRDTFLLILYELLEILKNSQFIETKNLCVTLFSYIIQNYPSEIALQIQEILNSINISLWCIMNNDDLKCIRNIENYKGILVSSDQKESLYNLKRCLVRLYVYLISVFFLL